MQRAGKNLVKYKYITTSDSYLSILLPSVDCQVSYGC